MRRSVVTALLVGLPAILVACGGGNTGTSSTPASGGTTSSCPAGSGSSGTTHLKIGSKGFAEEQLLATMTKLVLEAHGFTVDYTFQAKDKAIGQALTGGTIDMLWQYTGTELTDYLGLQTGSFPTDLQQAFTFVQQKDAANGLCWTSPTPFSDTNGLAIKASDQAKYGSTLSEFGTYLATHPGVAVCILSEFRTRPDGLPGLESTYNQSYSTASYTDIGSTAEPNIASGQCAAGEVFTTDSAIQANNLYVLKDDKNLFPPDNVGLVIRQSVLQANPAIASLMMPVAAKLDTTTMVGLNAMVEVQNLKVSDVAHTWLVQNGFLTS
jgi:osmoprotectant transport system substrate-binding protein